MSTLSGDRNFGSHFYFSDTIRIIENRENHLWVYAPEVSRLIKILTANISIQCKHSVRIRSLFCVWAVDTLLKSQFKFAMLNFFAEKGLKVSRTHFRVMRSFRLAMIGISILNQIFSIRTSWIEVLSKNLWGRKNVPDSKKRNDSSELVLKVLKVLNVLES